MRGRLPQLIQANRSTCSALTTSSLSCSAFGVTVQLLEELDRRGCTLVDTTCGSVLNVWKNVKRYAEQGYTAVIHGKVWHEETQATASQAVARGGAYLVVFNDDEAGASCATSSAMAVTAPPS